MINLTCFLRSSSAKFSLFCPDQAKQSSKQVQQAHNAHTSPKTTLNFKLSTQTDETLPPSCPTIISRTEWGAKIPKQIEYSLLPVKYVVIHHTVTPGCDNEVDCADLLSNMQNFHMNELDFHDIGYNFMIGGDGYVYEGAGWHKVGAHTRGYNTKSIGVAFIGNFVDKLPNRKQLDAGKRLLKCGVDLSELDARFKLIGARQVSSTQSPGLKLYQEIQKWPNFAKVS